MNIVKRRAVFLDRDGTINKEVHYLYKPTELLFTHNAIEAIKIFHNLGYLVIVVTNQSGVARGYYTEEDIVKLHQYMDQKLIDIPTVNIKCNQEDKKEYAYTNGYYIDAYYYCPHHKNGIIEKYAIDCYCRKPDIGMIEMAIKEFEIKGIHIDISNSFMVGDKETDIQTGINAGMNKTVLVRSNHKINEINTKADMIFDDIFSFAQDLMHNDCM